MMPFTNPRLVAEFDDWPAGKHRVRCRFRVLPRDRYGVRVSRETTTPAGVWCKPKLTTACDSACIVDGADGKTYVLQAKGPDAVRVASSDFMDARLPHGSGYVFAGSQPDLHRELIALIAAAYAAA